ncbi:MAG: hypothetical protein MUF15_20980 [Acidobacteria bacterium]|nr:hypothetical protein [Acidobacteriota bacterium]
MPINSSGVRQSLKYSLRKSNITAALLLPPPNPEPGGIRFTTKISNPF